jgi:hypothetical protein
MSAFTKGIYDVLSADATLTGLLNTYGDNPAIFSNDPVPVNAELAYIVISSPIADIDAGQKDRDGREVIQDIRCYINADEDLRILDQISNRVRALLHRQAANISIVGYNVIIIEASGGVEAPTEEEVYGQIVTVRMELNSTTII